jgi:hypothetical protein
MLPTSRRGTLRGQLPCERRYNRIAPQCKPIHGIGLRRALVSAETTDTTRGSPEIPARRADRPLVFANKPVYTDVIGGMSDGGSADDLYTGRD